MRTFFTAMAGGFFGKLLAVAFIAACITLGAGPDRWIEFVFQGSSSYLTPAAARTVLFGLGLAIALLLLLSIIHGPGASSTLTSDQLAFALSITGLQLFSDKLGKRKRNVQIGIGLRNASRHILLYDVDHIFVSVDGHTIGDPVLANKGLILRPGEADVFRYDTFKALDLPAESNVIVSVNISYGQPDHTALRHLRREYVGTLRVSATAANLTFTVFGEDFDRPI
jgi:hypothetical protein